jgi:hypothetical protein
MDVVYVLKYLTKGKKGEEGGRGAEAYTTARKSGLL